MSVLYDVCVILSTKVINDYGLWKWLSGKDGEWRVKGGENECNVTENGGMKVRGVGENVKKEKA